jgi:hypothetical protein
MESHGGMILTGKTEELAKKPVPVPNPAWVVPGVNLDLRGERRAINLLSHGTV